jgi:hypothetical protein
MGLMLGTLEIFLIPVRFFLRCQAMGPPKSAVAANYM